MTDYMYSPLDETPVPNVILRFPSIRNVYSRHKCYKRLSLKGRIGLEQYRKEVPSLSKDKKREAENELK